MTSIFIVEHKFKNKDLVGRPIDGFDENHAQWAEAAKEWYKYKVPHIEILKDNTNIGFGDLKKYKKKQIVDLGAPLGPCRINTVIHNIFENKIEYWCEQLPG
tara:strand:- start:1808 stop:2113 length:306 start_codon:yes stop_codon:yes gene_type:complete